MADSLVKDKDGATGAAPERRQGEFPRCTTSGLVSVRKRTYLIDSSMWGSAQWRALPAGILSGLGQGVIEMIGTRVPGIVGSLRKGSCSRLSLKAGRELLPEGAVL
jgi:hypothetical protein